VAVPTYQAFASTELLGQLALERMLAKLSCRRYPAGLEPVGTGVASTASGTSKSAISRRFVAATEHALAELLAQDLTGLDLVALLVDGIRVAEHNLRGRPRHHPGRHQAPAGAGRGLKRERHRGG
jgi:putative transposase